jgi:hypothetical protein
VPRAIGVFVLAEVGVLRCVGLGEVVLEEEEELIETLSRFELKVLTAQWSERQQCGHVDWDHDKRGWRVMAVDMEVYWERRGLGNSWG